MLLKNLIYFNKNSQKGEVLIVISLLVLIVILVIFLGVTSSLSKELKMFRSIEMSPTAYSAADSGAERLLYILNKESYTIPAEGETMVDFNFDGDTSYKVIVNTSSPLSFKSIGMSKNISRGIELSYY